MQEDIGYTSWIKLVEATELAASFTRQAERRNSVRESQLLRSRYLHDSLLLLRSEHRSVTIHLSQESKLCASFSALDNVTDGQFAHIDSGRSPVRCPIQVNGPYLTYLWKALKLPFSASCFGINEMRESTI
jgi:hypothetical protein